MNSAPKDRQRFARFLARIPPRWRQSWIGRGLFALVLLYALYLLAGNVFINTPIGEWTANRKPEKFHIEWGPGFTLWPGRVTVWDVKMGGQAGRTKWSVVAGKTSGRVAIWPLLRKEVRVPDVFATDVSGEVDMLPTRRPPPVARPGGWVLNFERIRSDSIRKGRFQTLTLEGTGRAEVGFYKQLRGGALELMPSTAHFDKAKLALKGDEMLHDATIDARFAIARHTRAQAPGAQKLLLTDAQLQLDGVTTTLKTGIDSKGHFTVDTVPGDGRASAKLGFARGVLTPGSKLQWHMPITGTDVAGRPRSGALDLSMDVDRDIVVKARAPSRTDSNLTLDADLRVRGNQIPLKDFHSLIPRSSGHVVGRWQFASLRWLGAFFTNAPWLALDGAGAVDADVRIVDGRVAAGSRISVPEVDAVAHVMGNRIRGRARADGRLDAGPDGKPLPSLELVMEQFNIAADDAPTQPYVDGHDLRLTMQTVSSFQREDLRKPDAMQQVREAMKARLTFSDARVPDLRAYNRYLPQSHLRFDGGSGTLSGDLSLDGAGDVGSGSVRIKASNAQLHAAGIGLRGNIDVDTPLRRADLSGHNFNIDGTRLNLTGISFTEPGGESRSGWWARIQLERARMDWDRPISIDARARVAMKDVGFLLSMFSRQRDYPKWVYKMIDSGQAQVSGNVQWKGDVLVLDRVDASNQRYDLKARLRLRGKSRTGSLYAKWGVLSCAVAVNNGQRDFHMIRAREWYDGQPALLR
ncbi:hypothetical protein [Lysobacter panacisoli]|uniref:Translocation/assembly module TamB n=1 Tax=Lysobacter panacisoli TaxID=1255263 RepID=A0ABP9L863_9GAMM|nr:hypothetical protein [Lysobacter panacisoli]